MKLNLILLGLGLVQGQNDTSGNEVDDLGNKKNKKNKTKNKARKLICTFLVRCYSHVELIVKMI